MKAMIFAAGLGTRLRPLTDNLPKALIPVQSRPIFDWVVESLSWFGVNEIIVNTHYLHDQIGAHILEKKFPVSITTSYEPEILGTGGGLFQTRDFWNTEHFLVQNVDILCTANLNQLLEQHKNNQWLATLAINQAPANSCLLVDEHGLLCGLDKKGETTLVRPPIGSMRKVNFCGIHAISSEIFSLRHPQVEFSIIDMYLRLVKEGEKIGTWDIGNAYWIDIGTQESLNRADKEFPGNIRS